MRPLTRALSIGILLLTCGAGCVQEAVQRAAVDDEMVDDLPLESLEVEIFEPIPIERPAGVLEPTPLGEPTDDAPINISTTEIEPSPAAAESPQPPDDGCVDDTQDDVADKPNDAAPAEPDPAVEAALWWLVDHQSSDGSWSFDHRVGGECRGRCDGHGTAAQATNAATAMALLPFLAVGQTHQAGEHHKAIRRGVTYLIRRAESQAEGVSFLETGGTMYSQGLATIALCEAFRQTKDKKLKPVCKGALDLITFAQDPVGGGWRYMPRQPGDTSVGGWQVAGLRAGHLAGLKVPKTTLARAWHFLDSVQTEDGATYGYTTPGAGRATTASGLVSRIHLGGKRDDAWRRGAEQLRKFGPSDRDMYYNYHAAQAIAQLGGEPWTEWQAAIRKLLLESQATEGHAKGSWNFTGGHTAARGGRLCNTSLATLILTIPRHELGVFQVEESDE